MEIEKNVEKSSVKITEARGRYENPREGTGTIRNSLVTYWQYVQTSDKKEESTSKDARERRTDT